MGRSTVKLEGSLDAFGLPDVLQLLAFTRKTGALHLTRLPDGRRGVVRVRSGRIDAASSDTGRQALARRLVGSGAVDDEALTAAVASVREKSRDGQQLGMVRALLEVEGVDRASVQRLGAEVALDAVCELLRWTAGEFSFVMDEPDPESLDLQLPVDETLAEGQARLAKWSSLAEHVPSIDTVVSLAVAPTEDPHCTKTEWGLLALADGTRTIGDMADLLGRGEFDVLQDVARLIERGLLGLARDGGSGGAIGDLQRRQALVASLESGRNRGEAGPRTGRRVSVEPDGPPSASAASKPSADGSSGSRPSPQPSAAGNQPASQPAQATAPPTSSQPGPSQPGSSQPAPQRPTLASAARSEEPAHAAASAAAKTGEQAADKPAAAAEDPAEAAATRSLLLRLMAGVQGL